jgi:hypothetical protein
MGNTLNPFSGTSEQKEKRGQRPKAPTDSSSNGNGQFMTGPYSMGMNAALQGLDCLLTFEGLGVTCLCLIAQAKSWAT